MPPGLWFQCSPSSHHRSRPYFSPPSTFLYLLAPRASSCQNEGVWDALCPTVAPGPSKHLAGAQQVLKKCLWAQATDRQEEEAEETGAGDGAEGSGCTNRSRRRHSPARSGWGDPHPAPAHGGAGDPEGQGLPARPAAAEGSLRHLSPSLQPKPSPTAWHVRPPRSRPWAPLRPNSRSEGVYSPPRLALPAAAPRLPPSPARPTRGWGRPGPRERRGRHFPPPPPWEVPPIV